MALPTQLFSSVGLLDHCILKLCNALCDSVNVICGLLTKCQILASFFKKAVFSNSFEISGYKNMHDIE